MPTTNKWGKPVTTPTHKKTERIYNSKKTLCGKKVAPEINLYRWADVTCKKCLKVGGF